MDYGITAVFGGLTHLAKYRSTWLENFYRVHRDWVERDEPPFAFVIPEDQRDPYATYRLLEILETGAVEIHRASSNFHADGKDYPAGSWVIPLDQPYGAFAKTMLELQEYPDLRYYPGGPPIPPYDVTAHTLGYLMGVDVDAIDEPLDAELTRAEKVSPSPSTVPKRPRWAYVIPPDSNAGFLALNHLSKEGVSVFRAGSTVDVSGQAIAPGAWLVPPSGKATRVLEQVAEQTGLPVLGADRAFGVDGFRMKRPTRVGLYKVANNMPAGWLMWLLEKYEFDYKIMASTDFDNDLSESYDVILLPAGTSKQRMLAGLSPSRHDESWRCAFGIGEDGWERLRQFVESGGTLVAVGDAVATARELLDLPIEPVLPAAPRRFRRGPEPPDPRPVVWHGTRTRASSKRSRALPSSSKLSSLSWLIQFRFSIAPALCSSTSTTCAIRSRSACRRGGQFFFRHDQAYRLKPSFDVRSDVVSKYPDEEDLVASGWLLGGELLRDQANVIAFELGRGSVVALGSQVEFRTQTEATFKLLFNALVQGPADELTASELARLR